MTIKAHKWLIIVELNILTMACLHLKYSFIRFFPLGVCYYTLYFVACSSKLTLNCAHTHCTGSQKSNNSNPSVSAVIKPLRELVSCHNWGGGLCIYVCMFLQSQMIAPNPFLLAHYCLNHAIFQPTCHNLFA